MRRSTADRAVGDREVVLHTVVAEIVSIVLLLAVLAFGAVSPSQAWAQTRELLPVVGFLAAVLALARLCDDDGLFAAAGDLVARACRGRPLRLLTGVFAVASLITAVLSLDATVVLLTPVVFATAARVGARPRPHVYACTHLANSASPRPPCCGGGSCASTTRDLAPADAEITLLHVTGGDVTAAAHGAFAGLLGRGHRGRDPGDRLEALSAAVAADLLGAAAARLGRAATRMERHGRIEHEVGRAAEGADLLVCARVATPRTGIDSLLPPPPPPGH